MNKKIVEIILIILIIAIIFFITDYILISTKHHPIFVIRTITYMDGGSYIAYGLGYKVCYYAALDIDISQDDAFNIGFWNLQYDTMKAADIDMKDAEIRNQIYFNIYSKNILDI